MPPKKKAAAKKPDPAPAPAADEDSKAEEPAAASDPVTSSSAAVPASESSKQPEKQDGSDDDPPGLTLPDSSSRASSAAKDADKGSTSGADSAAPEQIKTSTAPASSNKPAVSGSSSAGASAVSTSAANYKWSSGALVEVRGISAKCKLDNGDLGIIISFEADNESYVIEVFGKRWRVHRRHLVKPGTPVSETESIETGDAEEVAFTKPPTASSSSSMPVFAPKAKAFTPPPREARAPLTRATNVIAPKTLVKSTPKSTPAPKAATKESAPPEEPVEKDPAEEDMVEEEAVEEEQLEEAVAEAEEPVEEDEEHLAEEAAVDAAEDAAEEPENIAEEAAVNAADNQAIEILDDDDDDAPQPPGGPPPKKAKLQPKPKMSAQSSGVPVAAGPRKLVASAKGSPTAPKSFTIKPGNNSSAIPKQQSAVGMRMLQPQVKAAAGSLAARTVGVAAAKAEPKTAVISPGSSNGHGAAKIATPQTGRECQKCGSLLSLKCIPVDASCDECQMTVPNGKHMASCRPCNFDLCRDCFVKRIQQARSGAVATPTGAARPAVAKPAVAKPAVAKPVFARPAVPKPSGPAGPAAAVTISAMSSKFASAKKQVAALSGASKPAGVGVGLGRFAQQKKASLAGIITKTIPGGMASRTSGGLIQNLLAGKDAGGSKALPTKSSVPLDKVAAARAAVAQRLQALKGNQAAKAASGIRPAGPNAAIKPFPPVVRTNVPGRPAGVATAGIRPAGPTFTPIMKGSVTGSAAATHGIKRPFAATGIGNRPGSVSSEPPNKRQAIVQPRFTPRASNVIKPAGTSNIVQHQGAAARAPIKPLMRPQGLHGSIIRKSDGPKPPPTGPPDWVKRVHQRR